MTNYSANITSDADNFFQSDADLAERQRRQQRNEDLSKRGSPVALKSKALCIAVHQETLYVAESGFIARALRIKQGPMNRPPVGLKMVASAGGMARVPRLRLSPHTTVS